jgi:hypothetical protein
MASWWSGGERGKETNREWIILKYNASVCDGSITGCIEIWWIIAKQGGRERVSNRDGYLI